MSRSKTEGGGGGGGGVVQKERTSDPGGRYSGDVMNVTLLPAVDPPAALTVFFCFNFLLSLLNFLFICVPPVSAHFFASLPFLRAL